MGKKRKISSLLHDLNSNYKTIGGVDHIYADQYNNIVIEGIHLSRQKCSEFGLNPDELVVTMGEEFDQIMIPANSIYNRKAV